MSELQKAFEAAAEDVRKLNKQPTNEDLLNLYGLFKQATVGDNDTPKPSMMDFHGKYKWNAWNSNKGISKEDAMKKYIEFVKELMEKYA